MTTTGQPVEAAIERAGRYRDAGADMVFVQGADTADLLRRVCDAVPGPHLANVSQAGPSGPGHPAPLTVDAAQQAGAAAVMFPIAALLAASAARPGEAVISLGSTLVLKLISGVRVNDPARGIYGHRLGGLWLADGASNAGGAGLAAALPGADFTALSERIDPDDPTGLDL